MYGRDLQRGNAVLAHRAAALDHGRRAVGDDARDHRHASRGDLAHDRRNSLRFIGRKRMPFARAPAHRQAVNLRPFNQIASLLAERVIVDGAVRAKRRHHRREDSVDVFVHDLKISCYDAPQAALTTAAILAAGRRNR